MQIKKRTAFLAAGATVVVLAAGAGAWAVADVGEDESTRSGTCARTTYELSVEPEDGGIEVTFELQSAAPGETWDVVLTRGGTEIFSGQRTTDEDSEVDLDVLVGERGPNRFEARFSPALTDTAERCTTTVDR